MGDKELMSESVTLKEFFINLIKDVDIRFNDRYNSLEKLINKNSQEAKEAVKSALDAQEKAVNAALAAAEKAVQKAEIAAEKRFDNFTENYAENLTRISDDIKGLSEARAGGTGKEEGVKGVGGLVLSLITILIAIGAVVIAFLKA